MIELQKELTWVVDLKEFLSNKTEKKIWRHTRNERTKNAEKKKKKPTFALLNSLSKEVGVSNNNDDKRITD